MLYLNNINLNQNQLQNAAIQQLASPPSSPVVGQVYYDTGLLSMKQWNGSSWAVLDATKLSGVIPNSALVTNPLLRSNHTGTQTSSTISDLATVVQGYSLNLFAVPSGNISMNSYNINLLADPVLSTDAATKNYVDNSVQSSAAGISSKPSVLCIAVSNITLSGIQTIDSVSAVVGSRVLVVGQSIGTQNGVYVVSSGSWSRASNENTSSEMTPGAFWYVEQGAVYAMSQWILENSGVITIGTTSIVINQFGAGALYSAGNGLSLNGTQFSVNSGNGIIVDGSSTRVDTTVVARKYSVSIGDGVSTSYTVTHNLGTTDVHVTIKNISTTYIAYTDVTTPSSNTVVIYFAVAPSSNSYRVTVIG